MGLNCIYHCDFEHDRLWNILDGLGEPMQPKRSRNYLLPDETGEELRRAC